VDSVRGLDVPFDLSKIAGVAVVVAAAFLVNWAARLVMRQVVRRAVRQAIAGRGRWKMRLPRSHDAGTAEQRRLQRADAAAHMLSRITTVVVVLIAALIVTRIMGFDPVVLLSSAGFLGAGLAFGGQHVIKDWIVGLVVLVEDRYAVGDEITLTVGSNEISGTVETLGSTGVRIRLPDGPTWHGGHGSVEGVTNHSQQLIRHAVELPPDVWAELDHSSIGRELSAASHDLGLTDVLLVSDIAAEATSGGNTRVVFHASRPLTRRQQQMIAHRITNGSSS
jgi:small conductance mechanosensitive channel